MKDIRIDIIIHWLWALIFGILLITGLALMGAKFGWVMDNNLVLADYLHRTVGAAWVVLTFITIIVEASRLSKSSSKPMPWLVITKSGLGIFTLITTLLFILSGIFLWICKDFNHTILAFAVIIHDLLTFITLPVIVWHIFDKAYALPRD